MYHSYLFMPRLSSYSGLTSHQCLSFLPLLYSHFTSLLSSMATLLSKLPPPLPQLSSYWLRSQFPARPQGLFPVCPGAGGNLSRETNCLVSASCEHLAQPGMLSWVTPPETERRRLHTQTCARVQVHITHTLTPVLPSALYNYGPQGNVM